MHQGCGPCIQAATLRNQVDAFEFNSPKPFTHASHRAEWPRLADSSRSAHSMAGLEENGAGHSCNPMCSRLQPRLFRLQPHMYEAVTLCVPGFEGDGVGLGENSAPPLAVAAEAGAPSQEVRRGRAGWHC